MGSARHILALDLGTGGPKAALVAEDGSVVAWEVESTALAMHPGGGAEQDPADWWRALSACVRRLVEAQPAEAASLAAIAVTSQWSGTVAVDAAGEPLAPAVIWMDSRGAPYVDAMVGGWPRVAGYGAARLQRYLRVSGGLPSHSGKDPSAHIAWLRAERPDVFHAARWFLEPADYLVLRLTGRAVSSYDCIALHFATDNRDLATVSYDDTLLRWQGLERGRLPDLVPSATIVGELTDAVAAEWGLRPGTPVANAIADLHSSVLGSGALADYEGHLYLGTSSWLSCHVPWKRVDIAHNQTTLPSALPGRYFVVNEHETAGACLTFLVERVLVDPERLAAEHGVDSAYQVLDLLAAQAEPGSNGVIFTPWLNGERTPVDDHTVRAGFHNLSLRASREDLIRSVFEGVAYNSRWLFEVVQRFTKHPMPSLALVGGGAASDIWAQIHADVLGVPIRQLAEPRLAGVRGAAFLAWLALGAATPEDLARRVPIRHVYEPDPVAAATYEPLYAEFKELYKANKGIYRRLNAHKP